MIIRALRIIGLLVLVNINSAQASQPDKMSFARYSIEDGLSHSFVNCIIQDRQGFIWIGTEDGLNRFDGYTFEVFRPLPGDRHSLYDQNITHLFSDSHGYVWIGMKNGGISRYNPHSGTFETFLHDPKDPKSLGNHFIAINIYGIPTTGFLEDPNGRIWIGTRDGLGCYDYSQKAFLRFVHKAGSPETILPGTVSVMYIDRKGQLWAGTDHGLSRYDNDTRTFINFPCRPDNPDGLSDSFVTAIVEDSIGYLWVATRTGGLNRLIPGSEGFSPRFEKYFEEKNNPITDRRNAIYALHTASNGDLWVSLARGIVRCPRSRLNKPAFEFEWKTRDQQSELFCEIAEDNDQNIWFGSEKISGLVCYMHQQNQMVQYLNSVNNQASLSSNTISDIYIDRFQVLWIATQKGGVCKADLHYKPFVSLRPEPGNPGSLKSGDVYSIYLDETTDNLYAGTRLGLHKFNRRNGNMQYISYQSGSNRALSGQNVSVITPDPEGFLWVGYFDYKVSRYFPNLGTFEHLHQNAFKGWSMRTIFVDADKNVWLGQCTDGLQKYNRRTGLVEPAIAEGAKWQLNDIWITAFAEDPAGNLWLGTQRSGVSRYKPTSGEITHYQFVHGKSNSLASNEIHYLHLSPVMGSKYIWVGTSNGLSRLNQQTGEIRNYTISDGLPNNTIHAILEDSKGRFWLSTNKGICRFDPDDGSFRNYDKAHGLPGDEFNIRAAYQSASGEMFFGCTNGLVSFFPDSIKDNPYPPGLIFHHLFVKGQEVKPGDTINGQVILTKSIGLNNEIRLNHHNNDFSVGFTAIHYSVPSKNRYKYQLIGYDTDWKLAPQDIRAATYANLPAGTYLLKVKAANCDGIWNEEPATLRITILPPWWQTAWFRGLFALLILLIILAYVRTKTYLLQVQKRNLERQVRLHTAELSKNNQDLEIKNKLLEKQKIEIQHMADMLHEADQMKLRFFINISHEFRTPLTLILGPAEQILALQPSPVISENTLLIQRNAKRLLRLVNQLLDLRRLETGNMKLHAVEGDIVFYLHKIYESFTYLADRHQMNYHFSSEVPSLITWFDPDIVEKIMYNLLSNAFKYTPDGGTIKLDLYLAKEHLNIELSDTGVGIEPENLSHIFERFYRVETKSLRKQGGTGIGLSLARELTNLHHGVLDAVSKVGYGSTFTLSLPLGKHFLSDEEIEHAETADTENSYPHITSDVAHIEHTLPDPVPDQFNDNLPLLLAVDDNPEIIRFLQTNLSAQYNILTAPNGQAGLEKAFEYIPDIVVGDIMMPEMDGIEMCRQLKTDIRTSHIPIVLLTAKAEVDQQIKGLETGADDYVIKPFNLAILQTRLQNLVQSRSRLKLLFAGTAIPPPEALAINTTDRKFYEKLMSIIDQKIADPNLDGDIIAEMVGMSKTTLYRKLKSTIGDSVNIFIRNTRLKKAAELLREKELKISEVAYAVGFSDPAYFSKCFSLYFGKSPSEYLDS